jgi:hypothetical protein
MAFTPISIERCCIAILDQYHTEISVAITCLFRGKTIVLHSVSNEEAHIPGNYAASLSLLKATTQLSILKYCSPRSTGSPV